MLPALKQIKEICSLYQEQPATGVHGGQRTAAVVYRSEVINRLQQQMDHVEFSPDGRYSHTAQVSERLNFLRFLLRDGRAPAADSGSESSGSPAHHLYEVKLQGISSEQFRMILLLTLFRVPT